MAKIYLDQASTSYPKAPSVAQAVYDYLNGSAVNVNRGGYQLPILLKNRSSRLANSFSACFISHPEKAKM